jgi:hypothetical protein
MARLLSDVILFLVNAFGAFVMSMLDWNGYRQQVGALKSLAPKGGVHDI